MIEIARDRAAHRRFVTAPPRLGVAAFAEIREVAHQQHPERVGVIKQQRVVDLDVNAEQIETDALRVGDVVAQNLRIARGVNAVGIIRLVQRAADVDRLAVQTKRRGQIGVCDRLGRETAHAEIAVHDVAAKFEADPVEVRRRRVPKDRFA